MKNDQYLAYLRQQPCVLCGQTATTVHHWRYHTGTSLKPSDYWAIPLCPLHHNMGRVGVAVHRGKKTWLKKNFKSNKNIPYFDDELDWVNRVRIKHLTGYIEYLRRE